MCGIVGYVGEQEVLPILLEGLKVFEYRGMIVLEFHFCNQNPDRKSL